MADDDNDNVTNLQQALALRGAKAARSQGMHHFAALLEGCAPILTADAEPTKEDFALLDDLCVRAQQELRGNTGPRAVRGDPAAELAHLLEVMPLPARVLDAGGRLISEYRQLRAGSASRFEQHLGAIRERLIEAEAGGPILADEAADMRETLDKVLDP